MVAGSILSKKTVSMASAKHPSVAIFIQRAHVILQLAEGLISENSDIFEFSGFRDLIIRIGKIHRDTPILFYTPYSPIILLAFLFPRRNFYYLLHEPHLGRERVGALKFVAYEIWLFLTSLRCTFICASINGRDIASRKAAVARKLQSEVLPLSLNGIPKVRKNPPDSYDIGMWGSINREKGIERFLELARANRDLRMGVLTAANDRMLRLSQECRHVAPNVTFELHEGGFSDSDLESFISRTAVVALPQWDATQSGQLPFALRSGMPAITSNIGAFRQYCRTPSQALKLIDNNLSPAEFAKEMKECLSDILTDYEACSRAAAQLFNEHHSAVAAQSQMRKILRMELSENINHSGNSVV